GVHREIEEARRRLDRLLLGKASRGAAQGQDHLRFADARLARAFREARQDDGEITEILDAHSQPQSPGSHSARGIFTPKALDRKAQGRAAHPGKVVAPSWHLP